MIKRANNPGVFIKHPKWKIEYLKNHAYDKTDGEIAKMLSLSINQINYYRTQVLGLWNKSGRPVIETCTMEDIKGELNALLVFHKTYNGSMIDSLEQRIKLLSSKLC